MKHLKYFGVGLFWLAFALAITAVAGLLLCLLVTSVAYVAMNYTTIFGSVLIGFIVGKLAYELGKGMSNMEGLPEELDEPIDDSDE
jgi:hypothetical protein